MKDAGDALQAGRPIHEGTLVRLHKVLDDEGIGGQRKEKWAHKLKLGARMEPTDTPSNIILIFENESALLNLLQWDERRQSIQLLRTPPWDGKPGPRDLEPTLDGAHAAKWLQEHWKLSTHPSTMREVFGVVARGNSVDPVKVWLESLVWDKTPRLHSWLHRYCGATDTKLNGAFGTRWLISGVARAFTPGCQVDHVLVLEGKQGTGKSSLLRELFRGHYRGGIGDKDLMNKDTLMLISSAWGVELAEMASVKKADVDSLKQFLTECVDHYRPPYGTEVIANPRRCIFAATTNEDEWLRDGTGNRRFWPVNTGEIDLAGLIRDRAQLWAEAVEQYREGRPWHMVPGVDDELITESRVLQGEKMVVHPWADAIEEWSESREECYSKDVYKMLDIPLERQTVYTRSLIAQCMQAAGWTKEKRVKRDGKLLLRWIKE